MANVNVKLVRERIHAKVAAEFKRRQRATDSPEALRLARAYRKLRVAANRAAAARDDFANKLRKDYDWDDYCDGKIVLHSHKEAAAARKWRDDTLERAEDLILKLTCDSDALPEVMRFLDSITKE